MLSPYCSACLIVSTSFARIGTSSKRSYRSQRAECLEVEAGDARYFSDDPDARRSLKRLQRYGFSQRGRSGAISTFRRSSLAIDMYAAEALCNPDCFLNKPYGIGGD
jgi:hypothetical protein